MDMFTRLQTGALARPTEAMLFDQVNTTSARTLALKHLEDTEVPCYPVIVSVVLLWFDPQTPNSPSGILRYT